MQGKTTGRLLSTVFVDYDNIYLSLKRKNEEAAKLFAKNAGHWLREIESGGLITATNSPGVETPRRIIMSRCYGNSVPRRNGADNSTDMNSYPFVRHHFLRAGFEAIDCPPVTAQLKNSADIRMVMDIRDYIGHDTYFDEFVILSSDSDFTPLLHRLRAHARRTIVYVNDHTVSPYTAIADGEVRENDLIARLLGGKNLGVTTQAETAIEARPQAQQRALPDGAALDNARREIIDEVAGVVRVSRHPVPLEHLADRAVRLLGHDRTVGSAWGGAGTFRELALRALPSDIKMTDQAPYYLYQVRAAATARPAAQIERSSAERPSLEPMRAAAIQSTYSEPMHAEPLDTRYDRRAQALSELPPAQAPVHVQTARAPQASPLAGLSPRAGSTAAETTPPMRAAQPQTQSATVSGQTPTQATRAIAPLERHTEPAQTPRPQQPPQPQQRGAGVELATTIQQSIARIHEACQAPPMSPPEYRVLFEVMAQEIIANGLIGGQTLTNIATRAEAAGVAVRREDVRFVLEVVSEADPWFEQGASVNLFAGRFRNFVVARCRAQGLQLSADELDLIEAWFAGGPATATRAPLPQQQAITQHQLPAQPQAHAAQQANMGARTDRWLESEEAQRMAAYEQSRLAAGSGGAASFAPAASAADEFPRIVRTRQRG